MQDYLRKYGIKSYINAHDTITLYGACRLAENTKAAMDQISKCFVDMEQLQCALGQRLARLTHNEDAYLSNGAAGAVQLCAAVCLAQSSEAIYKKLPNAQGIPHEIIVLHAQHNCYDKALEAAGAVIKQVGDADETLAFELRAAITDNTVAVFYCPAITYARGSLSLQETVCIAHEKNIPVIVDAASQLPPVDNLWNYTQQGADMVVFSGGKALCGPQTSGLIVGKTQYLQDCRRFGSPTHGVCRSAKTSRESMIGLCVAVENYLQLDHTAHRKQLSLMVDQMLQAMSNPAVYTPYRKECGSVGQSYPRAFAVIHAPLTAQYVVRVMKEKGIFIGIDVRENAIYLSPLALSQAECDVVCEALLAMTGSVANATL